MADESKQNPAVAPPYEPGRLVGDFELVEALGQGCVQGNLFFRARCRQSVAADLPPDSIVGLEVMLAAVNQTKAARRARARFELLATAEGDALPRYVDFFTHEEAGREIPCIVTTNPVGEPLPREMAARTTGHTWEETKALADTLLRTLARLNDTGAPLPRMAARNIFFKTPRELSLVNLELIDPSDLSTRAGAALTDFEYLAPDLLSGGRDDEVSFRIFGLGVCLFEFLYGGGCKPFGVIADHASWLKVWKAVPPPVPQHPQRADLPPTARAFLDRCLSADRNARFHTFSEAVQALHSAGTTRGGGIPTAERTPVSTQAGATRIVGDYELIGDAPIGFGAQGVVWKATCTASGKEFVRQGDVVALKILNPHVGDLSKTEHRFKSLCKLRHPNIVEYKDVFIHPDGARCCIAMEFVEGDALDKILERSRASGLPWLQARDIISQCLEALTYAASQNVVHRDIKPPNIRITPEGRVKIIDFEIARRVGGASTVPTVQGFAGTFAYMAPEFAGENPFSGDEQSDVFSAGACFFEVVSGGLPFDPFVSDQQHFEFIRRWIDPAKWPQPRVDHVRSPVPLPEVRAFLTKLCKPDRGERYPKFATALADFRRFLPVVIGESDGEQYEFDESVDLLGKGGFGSVYRGRRRRDGLIVAIKRLHSPKYLKRFARERNILQRINHPNIVRFLDFVEMMDLGQSEYFIVMEYLDGMPQHSLRRRIKQTGGPLPVDEAVGLFASYLSAVQHLHENGVIHRDLTPNNLYAPPGRPADAKVIDLGVAMDETGTLSVSGGLPGVPDYMAPEFATRDNVRGSPQTDLFSVGICFFEALTGHKPFPALPTDVKRSWAEWVKRSQKVPSVDFTDQAFVQYPALRRIAERAMAPEPEQRYESAKEMARDLVSALDKAADEDTIATQVGPRLSPPPKPAAPPRPPVPKPSEVLTGEAPRDAEHRQVSSTNRWLPPTVERMREILPQYEFISMLGVGGMGAVYKARQKLLDRFVAIKILPPGIEDDMGENYVERFKNEARTMAKMNHPCIVNVHDFGEANDGQLYFVMEYVDGTDLQKLIRANKRLKPDDALSISIHVCDALQYAHSRGVIHRDIKPANVLISAEGLVKIADFGLAKSFAGQSTELTRANIALGTPYYMAPEALHIDVKLDSRADLYAVGVMLYNMLTGELPMGGWKMPSEMLQIDPRFDSIIKKATEKDREQRYQTAADIRRDLTTILSKPHRLGETTNLVVPQERPAAKPAEEGKPKPAPKPPPPPPKPVPVIEFSATDGTIPKGGSTRLRWSVKLASSIWLDGQKVEPLGEKIVKPEAKTTYKLVAEGEGGKVQKDVTVRMAVNWKPIIRGGVALAAAASIIAGAGYWWTHRQLSFENWDASLDSVTKFVAFIREKNPEQTAQSRTGAGAKFEAAFKNRLSGDLKSGKRTEAAALLPVWVQAASLLRTNGIAVEAATAVEMQKDLSGAFVSAFNEHAQATNTAQAQAVMAEWIAATGRLAGVASFDAAIVKNMQDRLKDIHARLEAAELFKELQAAASLDALGKTFEKYRAYSSRWSKQDILIESRAPAMLSNLVATATGGYTMRPASLDAIEKLVTEMVQQRLLPAASSQILVNAGARITANNENISRVRRFQTLTNALATAATIEQLETLRKQAQDPTWTADQVGALNQMLVARAAFALDAMVPGDRETDPQKLVQAQVQLRRLPDWIKQVARYKELDKSMDARIASAEMAAKKQAEIARLRAAIPPAPLVSYPNEYAAFAIKLEKVRADASNEMLYPAIAADISVATNTVETALWAALRTSMAAWNSAERPAELNKWVSAARAATTPELPSWAKDTLGKTIELIGGELKRTEVSFVNDSRYAVEVRWPVELARPVDRVAPGARTNLAITSDADVTFQVAVAPTVSLAARRKVHQQTAAPGRRTSVTVNDDLFTVMPTVVTWIGPKEIPGVTLQVDGGDFAPGQTRNVAPETTLKLLWKRPDHQNIEQPSVSVGTADRLDLVRHQPPADKWMPTEDLTLATNFIASVAKQDVAAVKAGKTRATRLVIQDPAVREALAAALGKSDVLVAGLAQTATRAVDRVRAACYLYTASNATRDGRIAAAAKRIAAMKDSILFAMRSATDTRTKFWLGLVEKGDKLSGADIETALQQIPASGELDADRVVLTYLFDGPEKASQLPQNHPEYSRYRFHVDVFPNFLLQDVEEGRIVETADSALAYLLSPPPSIVIEKDDLTAAMLFIKNARAVADKQSDWVSAQALLKKLQEVCQTQAARVN